MSYKSWVDSANDGITDFPLTNLPLGVFSRGEGNHRIGVAIGDRVLDLRSCVDAGLLASVSEELQKACAKDTLNSLMALGRAGATHLRRTLTALLSEEASKETRNLIEPHLFSMQAVTMHLPAAIGDYTDFYASIYHARNVGSLFRPDNPLLPNYKYVPIGYHGRASSIVVSGTDVKRPHGQTKSANAEHPEFAPSRLLDYELEVGFFISKATSLGEPVALSDAEEHIFGLCLLNDWSARDIQAWEYQPLGPFLAKNFATTISPWVVTMEALKPFRGRALAREADDPRPLPYLLTAGNEERGGIDLKLEVLLSSQRMRDESMPAVLLSRSNTRDLYWTLAQMLAHHASNGCNLRPGDLMGSGTVSGPTKDSAGCLLEMTRRGAEPIHLPSGEIRTFLEDGDEVIFHGYCEREGFPRIGFGECRGRILAAI